MKKILSLVLVTALLVSIMGLALATDTPIRVIQGEERMMLEGKDIFTYTSGELCILWEATELPDELLIKQIDSADEDEASQIPGLYIPFEEFQVLTFSADEDAAENREMLHALPLTETQYPVTCVTLKDSGAIGPFGIEVGMTVETLQSLLPESSEETLNAGATGYDASYTMRYQDVQGNIFVIEVLTLLDMVSHCTITRE
ncbi:MAG: hypothetical protein GX096_08790 [Clostridiales bacterium]|nr:hypothetical protein [Clostridiales bacterium]